MNSTEIMVTASTILGIVAKYTFYADYIIIGGGIVGNIINILVFTRLKFFRDNRCIFYLTVESISNILYLFNAFISTILKQLFDKNIAVYSFFWCRFIYIFSQSFGLITSSMICCAAADQFFSTNYRVNLRQTCTLKLARYLTCIITVIWIVHGVVFALFVNSIASIGCIISNSILIRYATYFLYPVLATLLPVATASLLSLLAYRNVRRIVRRQIPIQRRRLDRQITAMVLLRVVFFVIATVPFIIYRIYALNVKQTSLNSLGQAISQLSQQTVTSVFTSNYAANFYLFIISSSRYGRQVKYVLIKKFWQSLKLWCSTNRNVVHPENPTSANSNNEIESNM